MYYLCYVCTYIKYVHIIAMWCICVDNKIFEFYWFTVSSHTCDVCTRANISELLTYANSWSTKWEVIGLKLGLSPLKLNEIFMDHRLVTDCCRYMLLEWTRSAPNSCYCKLVTTLDELDLKYAAYRLAKDTLTGLATDCIDAYSKETHKICKIL